MLYEVYALDPDAELVGTCKALEGAIEWCEELVHDDGYRSAEVWDEDGQLLYAASDACAELPSGSRFRTITLPEPLLHVAGIAEPVQRDADPRRAVRHLVANLTTDAAAHPSAEPTALADADTAELSVQAHGQGMPPSSAISTGCPAHPVDTVHRPPQTAVLAEGDAAPVQWFGV